MKAIGYVDLERSVLAACLRDPSMVSKIIPIDGAWCNPTHAAVAAAMLQLHRGGSTQPSRASIVTIARDSGAPEQVVSLEILETIAAAPCDEIDVSVASIAKAARVRDIANGAAELAKRGRDPKVLADPEAFLASARGLSEAARGGGQGAGVSARDAVMSWMAGFASAASGDVASGALFGLPALDRLTCGLQPTELTVLAARPGEGKSALVACGLLAGAMAGHPQLFFQLEMSTDQTIGRLVSIVSGVDGKKLRRGVKLATGLTPSESRQVLSAAQVIADLPIQFEDSLTRWSDIEAAIEAFALSHAGAFVSSWVDYIQLASGSGGKREESISGMSRGAKLVAKRTRSHVGLVAQLNRDNAREGREPELTDLRESGSLEQDADNVIFIHHPDGLPETDAPPLTRAMVLVKKNRGAERGRVLVGWRRSCTRFEDAG